MRPSSLPANLVAWGRQKPCFRIAGKLSSSICLKSRTIRASLPGALCWVRIWTKFARNFPDESASVVVNPDWRQGQLSSIQAAIRTIAADETAGIILCPVDHPLFSPELIAQLIDAFDSTGQLIVLPIYHGRRGHPVIFAASLYPELLAASPAIGAREVVWAHAAELREVPTEEEGVVLNINDPETLRRALENREPEA